MSRRTVEVLIKAKDETKKAVDSSGKGFKKLQTTLAANSKLIAGFGAAAVAALGLATTAAFKFLDSVAKMEDQMAKAARRAQVDISTYGEWSHVIQLAGGQAGTFEKAIQALSRQMVTADQGSTTVMKAFEDLGVSIYTASGELKSADVIFEEVITGLQGMEDATKRSGLAQILMSRSGKILLPVLEQTSDAIAQQRLEWLDLGGRAQVAASVAGEEWVDSQLRVKTATDGVKASLLSAFGPQVTASINGMSEVIASLGASFSQSGTIDSIEEINELFNNLVKVADVAPSAITAMGEAWDLSLSIMTGNAHSFGLSLIQMKQAIDGIRNPEYGSSPIDWTKWNFGAETYIDSVKRAHEETLALSQGLKITEAAPYDELIDVDAINAVHGRIEEGARKITEEYQAGVDTLIRLQEIMESLTFTTGNGAIEAEYLAEGIDTAALASDAFGTSIGRTLAASPFNLMTDQAFDLGKALISSVVSALNQVIAKLVIIKAIEAFASGPFSFLKSGTDLVTGDKSGAGSLTKQLNTSYPSPYGDGRGGGSGGGTVILNMNTPDTMAGMERLRGVVVGALSGDGAI